MPNAAKRRCRLFHVDSFTRQRFCGNPAGVVLDADELEDEEMQILARELNYPETAFVQSAESPDHDLRVRFFTPRHEVPFVAHATVAAQYVRALKQGPPRGKLRQLTGAGVVEIEVRMVDDDYRVAITQSPASLGPIIPDHHRTQVLNAIGISSPSLHKKCPLQLMTKGSTRLLIGLESPDLLARVKPDFAELARLTPHVGAEGYFLFALEEPDDGHSTASRMFCPSIGIDEDPASGNGHGMLGVYLVTHGLLTPSAGRVRFRGHQGEFVDRPSTIEVEVSCSGTVAQSVRILGDAVIVYEAELPM